MWSVILSFNKENVSLYLDRAYRIVTNTTDRCGHKPFTVLHLCSVHIIKAVCQAFSKKTTNKAVKEYATYCFALLLNSTFLEEAIVVFEDMCLLFTSDEETDAVSAAKGALDLKITSTKGNKNYTDEDMPQANDISESATTNGNSPFTAIFTAALDRATNLHSHSAKTGENNIFFCPDIIRVLMDTYMGIFPFWSGVLLGDLSRFSELSIIQGNSHPSQTRETNCHVEQWFCTVKQSILQRTKFLRPRISYVKCMDHFKAGIENI